MANLTQAWTSASAALPLGWKIAGVALGPTTDERDPMVILEEHWVAWAVNDADGDRRNGVGDNPIQALLDLAAQLRPVRGDRNG